MSLNPLRKIPFFRWSFIRMGIGMKHLLKEWQVGDGREERLAQYVLKHAKPGDAQDTIRVIDRYAYDESFLMNVGDEKGEILDEAVRRAGPKCVLALQPEEPDRRRLPGTVQGHPHRSR